MKNTEITIEYLESIGFIREPNGAYWIDRQTYYIELIVGGDGYFYPVIAQLPEISAEMEQRVMINRIRYEHELQNIFLVVFGQEK